MRIFGIRIMFESNYRNLVKFKNEVEEILRRRLPVVMDKTLTNKNITLSRGLVLVNSWVKKSSRVYKGKEPIKVFPGAWVMGNFFSSGEKTSLKEV